MFPPPPLLYSYHTSHTPKDIHTYTQYTQSHMLEDYITLYIYTVPQNDEQYLVGGLRFYPKLTI